MINALSDANILLVDDDEELLRLSERRLARAGFGDLTSTTDALDALNLFEGEKFDLVILDLRMPGMDGIHLAARMRKLRSPKESAIIVLSAVDNDKLIGQLLKQGVIDDFIRKPPGSMEFIARVERILQRFLA
jgi:DNA-binding response OmpR family regulator